MVPSTFGKDLIRAGQFWSNMPHKTITETYLSLPDEMRKLELVVERVSASLAGNSASFDVWETFGEMLDRVIHLLPKGILVRPEFWKKAVRYDETPSYFDMLPQNLEKDSNIMKAYFDAIKATAELYSDINFMIMEARK